MQRRRERYIIIHMWKILHQRCPNDLGIHFSTPSRHGIKATIPSLSKSSTQRQQSLYDGSFAVMGPRLWNIIPSDLHLIEDPLLFKAKLSEFLKPFPDNPSVSNYSCPNEISSWVYPLTTFCKIIISYSSSFTSGTRRSSLSTDRVLITTNTGRHVYVSVCSRCAFICGVVQIMNKISLFFD